MPLNKHGVHEFPFNDARFTGLGTTVTTALTFSEDVRQGSLTFDAITGGLNPLVVSPVGYRLYCADVLTFRGNVLVAADGGDGNNAAGTTPGSGGIAAVNTGARVGAAHAGAAGGGPGQGGGAGGGNAVTGIGGIAGAGGAGDDGTGGAGGNQAWAAAQGTWSNHQLATYGGYVFLNNGTFVLPRAGAGGGGGGGSPFGAGGGGGGGGGTIFISAQEIVIDGGTLTLQAKGGNGGNASSSDFGAGGGGGGGGGVVILVYGRMTFKNGGAIAYAANGGNGGNGVLPGGGAGLAGGPGQIIHISESGFKLIAGSAGSNGTAGS